MEIDRVLRVNARLEIRQRISGTMAMARVAEVGPEEFAITALYGGSASEFLRVDEIVDCSLADDEGHAQYGFKSKVLRREAIEVPLYYLTKPAQVIRMQRRGFVRVQVLIGAEYSLEGNADWVRAYLLDLSGGGAKLSHYEKLPANRALTLSFKIRSDEPSLFLDGKIVRSVPVSTSVGNIYHSGVEFINIPVGLQDSIVAFVFGRLLDTRRAGEGRL